MPSSEDLIEKAFRAGYRSAGGYFSTTIRQEREDGDWLLFQKRQNLNSDTSVPDDVRRLVIATRRYLDTSEQCADEEQELMKAVEAFSSRVPYDDESTLQTEN